MRQLHSICEKTNGDTMPESQLEQGVREREIAWLTEITIKYQNLTESV